MGKKKEALRKIDQKTLSTGAPLPLVQEDQPAPPAFYLLPAPDTLVVLGQAIGRSMQASIINVALGWQEAPNIAPDYYNVEWDLVDTFTNVQRKRASTTSATIEGLKPQTTYYFRVQAVLGGIYSPFSETLTMVTMADTTPPPDVTGASAAFQNSDLVITYTIPTSELIKDVKIEIYNAAHTVLYATIYTTSNRFVWTAEQNIFATGGTPLTSVSVDIHTNSWSNTISTPGVNVTATAPVPSTPVGYTSNWIGDDGQADEDFVTTWLAAANADSYDITVDAIAYKTKDLRFVYRYDQNVADHRPTLASGQASFIWTLRSRDKLGQVSTPVNVTVSNIAPSSTFASLTATGGFSSIGAYVTINSAKIIQDLSHFEWTVNNGVIDVQNFISYTPDVIIQLASSGTYSVSVKLVDKFNQKSSAITQGGIVLDTLTLEQLRAETIYTDSFSNASSVLNVVMKNGILYTGVLGDAVRYTNTSGVWNWLKASRPLVDRYKTISLSAAWPNNAKFYFEFNDGSTSTYYAAPVTTGSAGQSILTKYTVLATAQANPIIKTPAGTGDLRYDLPNIQEARTITLWFDTIGSDFDIYEYYPRRIVQSDDIEAENIKSINLAAGSVIASKINVVNLQAVSAQMGNLHMDGVIDIATGGGIYQGTGSFLSPTTGLKVFNSSGVGKISTYNAGVEQVTFDTDGILKAGAGSVKLNADGIRIGVASLLSDIKSYGFTGASNFIGGLYGSEDTGVDTMVLWKKANTGKVSTLTLDSRASSGTGAVINSWLSSGLSVSVPFYASNDGTTIKTEIDAAGSNGKVYLKSPVYTTYQIYPNNQSSYYLSASANGLVTNSTLSVGSTIAATRGLSIFGDNQYVSWNNAAGSEKWVAGYEAAGSDRWILYTPTAGYAIYASSAGDIGFGNITPTAKLQVHSSTLDSQVYVSSAAPRIALGNHVTYASRTNEVRLVMATANGHFGLPTAGDGWLFTGAQNGGTSGALYLGANTGFAMAMGSANNVSIVNKMYIGGTGTVPSFQIQLSTDSAGKPTTSTWSVISDSRSKTKVIDRTKALDRVKQLKIKEFEFTGAFGTEKDTKGIGVIAEELQAIYPNSVKTIEVENEQVLSVNYHELFVDYAVAIQELLAEIESLKSKIK